MKTSILEFLGVQPKYYAKPNAYSYPPKLNQNAYYLWLRIVEGADIQNTSDPWDFALRALLADMHKRHLPLWRQQRTEYDNEWIVQYMRLRRKRMVKYMDDLGILKGQTFWKLLTRTKVTFMQNGFVIESTVVVRDPDVKHIMQVLKANKFYPDLTKDKIPDLGYRHWRRWMPFDLKLIKVGFAVQSRRRAHFYYQIFCPRMPYTDFHENMESSIRNMWRKLVFQFRFKWLNWTSEF